MATRLCVGFTCVAMTAALGAQGLQRKGLVLDGNNPTLMSGYGGFNIATTPNFNPPSITTTGWFRRIRSSTRQHYRRPPAGTGRC